MSKFIILITFIAIINYTIAFIPSYLSTRHNKYSVNVISDESINDDITPIEESQSSLPTSSPSSSSPLQSPLPTILSLQSSFYTLLQSSPTSNQLLPFLSTPTFHLHPPPSTSGPPTFQTTTALSHLTSLDPTLSLSLSPPVVVAESPHVFVTSFIETVTSPPLKAGVEGEKGRRSRHDRWEYRTVVTWVKEDEGEGEQWRIR